jgi:hypothetical protein
MKHEPTSDAGTPSSSLKGLLSYLQACSFPDRPQMIILSCTQRFGRDSMEPDAVDSCTCMQDIALALGKQGYVGAWRSVCPSMFFLPLHRPRMYGLFLKLHKAGPEGLAQRRQDLHAALSLLGRLKRSLPEELEAVLARRHGRPTMSSGAPRTVQRKRCSSVGHHRRWAAAKRLLDRATMHQLKGPAVWMGGGATTTCALKRSSSW